MHISDSTPAPSRAPTAPVDGDQRSVFLKRALVVGGAALAGGALAGAPHFVNAQGANADVRALNLALLVEYAEAEFYAQALAAGALKGEVLKFAEQVSAQESEHLAFLKKALGDKADPKPKFDFGDRVKSQDQFAATAAVLEDLAVPPTTGRPPTSRRAPGGGRGSSRWRAATPPGSAASSARPRPGGHGHGPRRRTQARSRSWPPAEAA